MTEYIDTRDYAEPGDRCTTHFNASADDEWQVGVLVAELEIDGDKHRLRWALEAVLYRVDGNTVKHAETVAARARELATEACPFRQRDMPLSLVLTQEQWVLQQLAGLNQ